MRFIQNMAALMLVLQSFGSILAHFAATPAMAHFIYTSPWMLLFWLPFALMGAYGLRLMARGGNNGQKGSDGK